MKQGNYTEHGQDIELAPFPFIGRKGEVTKRSEFARADLEIERLKLLGYKDTVASRVIIAKDGNCTNRHKKRVNELLKFCPVCRKVFEILPKLGHYKFPECHIYRSGTGYGKEKTKCPVCLGHQNKYRISGV